MIKTADILRRTFPLGAFLLLASMVLAQNPRSQNPRKENPRNQNAWGQNIDRFTMDRTENGKGTVRVGGKNYSFTSLRVSLQRGRKVTLKAVKSGVDVVMTGTWDANPSQRNSVGISIDRVTYRAFKTDRVRARGRIQLRGNDRFTHAEVGGRNVSDKNNVQLNFNTSGFVGDRNDDWDRNDDNWGDRDNWTDRNVAGRYTDYEQWSQGRDDFQIRYSLDLTEQSHRARLVATSEDRNMPNDSATRLRHGDILNYLQDGHEVIQTGTWKRGGDRVTIDFNRIEYGRTSRDKRERFVGQIRGSAIYIESWERSFYGRDVELTFERS